MLVDIMGLKLNKKNEDKKRVFIAIEIPKEIKEAIAETSKELNEFEREKKIKKVETRNYHITLKFVGEISNETIDKISKILEVIVKKYNPMELELSGVGVFPNKNYIRIVWIGTKEIEKNTNNKTLGKLVEEINNELEKIGITRDKNKFSPHITIARVKRKIDLSKFIEKNSSKRFGRIKINNLALVESILAKGKPPRYIILKKFRYQGNN